MTSQCSHYYQEQLRILWTDAEEQSFLCFSTKLKNCYFCIHRTFNTSILCITLTLVFSFSQICSTFLGVMVIVLDQKTQKLSTLPWKTGECPWTSHVLIAEPTSQNRYEDEVGKRECCNYFESPLERRVGINK